jgi:hypothetical protein
MGHHRVMALLLAAATTLGMGAVVALGAPSAVAAPAARHRVSPLGLGSRRAPVAPSTPKAAAPAATTTVTEWVSGSMPVGADTSCASPGYQTISSALAAAPSGATIKVCSGTYPEQLAITGSVTLSAVGAVTVLGPASPSSSLTSCDADGGSQPNQDVVDICGSGITVNMSGFTIEGSWPSDVCYDSLYGVAVLGGADLNLSNSTVQDIGGDPQSDGCQGGVGIEVGLATSGTTADPGVAKLTNDVVSNYQKNGITVDGKGSSATISGATVEGTGPTPATAQNGIQVSDAAGATISGSFVSGDECNVSSVCGPDGYTQTQAAGILLFDAGATSVSSTNVTASDIGVYNIEDYAWAYYTPPSPFTPVVQKFSGMGLANRYENAYFDEGGASLTGSRVWGGEVGLEVAQWNGQTTPPHGSLTSDTIADASQDAVLVASDQTGGDEPVKLTINTSSLDTSNAGGMSNQSYSVVIATKDWWGDLNGPSAWGFGAGSSVSSDVNFFPWSTDSNSTTFATCTTGLNETTTSNDVVLCAKAGTGNAYLANSGPGNVLLIGNKGNDQLAGSSAGGETWIIGGNPGHNAVNGNGGTGYIQLRGNPNDTLTNAAGYTVASR